MALSTKTIVTIGAVVGLTALGVYTIASAKDGEKKVMIMEAAQSLPQNQRTEASGGDAGASGSNSEAPSRAGGTVRSEGRVSAYPGAMVHVGTETGGRLARLLVHEQQTVTRGSAIADIASDEEQAALAEAKARIREADASITFLTSEKTRADRLIQTNAITRQGAEKIARDLESAQAQRAVAAATVQRIEAVLRKMRITAPIDGVVTSRYVEQGEVIGAGTRIVTIADLSRRRIEAEIDEYDLSRVRVGDSVNISAEGFGTQVWKGVVEQVPDIVAQRRLEPNDPGRPLDTRVLLVKITMPQESPLKLGQRVEIEIVP